MENLIFELQPLRIQAGWKVEYNNFYNCINMILKIVN